MPMKLKHQYDGFTLVEALLIFMLIVLIASAVMPYFYHNNSKNDMKEQRDILLINNALKLYKLDNGTYPTEKQGLVALVIKPQDGPIPAHWTQYLITLPQDTWGRSYQYQLDESGQQVEVFSCGLPRAQQSIWYRINHFLKSRPYACQLMDKEEHS